MEDDRKSPRSSDDLLRAARTDAESTSQNLRPNARKDGAGSDRQRTDSGSVPDRPAAADRSADRSVVGVARFVPVGELLDKLKGSKYVLTVDDVEIADVYTEFEKEPAHGFYSVRSMRFTTVNFRDRRDVRWRVGAEEPGPRRTKTKRSGKQKEYLFGVSDRRAYVDEESRVVDGFRVTIERRRLAQTNTPIANGFASWNTTVTASGQEFPLERPLGFMRRGSIGERATFARGYPFRMAAPWSVDVRWAVPLSVIVLGWHLLYGDIRMEGNG